MIKVDRPEQGIVQILLNRPDKRNALSIGLMEELCREVDKISNDDTVRCVIIGGEGPIFCAGLDLHEASDPGLVERSAEMIAHTFSTIYHCPKITIAAIHGAVIGGGGGILCACDYAIASPGTQISFPEARRGLIAVQVLMLLRRVVSERTLRELLLIGEPVSTQRALTLGLINQISASLHLDALAVARQAMLGAPQTLEKTKELIDRFSGHTVDQDIRTALKLHEEMRQTSEAKEGISAFRQKRKPVWQP